MATITLGPYTLSAADQTRVLAAYQVAANADLNTTATPSQVLAYVQKLVRQQIVANVLSFEQQAAQTTAAAGVNQITMT